LWRLLLLLLLLLLLFMLLLTSFFSLGLTAQHGWWLVSGTSQLLMLFAFAPCSLTSWPIAYMTRAGCHFNTQ
jgi:accessory gene regulator protein AgrB